jgi:hypothetical protein
MPAGHIRSLKSGAEMKQFISAAWWADINYLFYSSTLCCWLLLVYKGNRTCSCFAGNVLPDFLTLAMPAGHIRSLKSGAEMKQFISAAIDISLEIC